MYLDSFFFKKADSAQTSEKLSYFLNWFLRRSNSNLFIYIILTISNAVIY
ncbi:hypothetical protein J588_2702 [Acinetobacter sp. 1578804]|nr:hypothetical protein J588_2702 [Acinetobacter sp. 1578804]EXH33977.1 hypothetical protein J623_1770 [Acinetobacter sp. 1245249]EYT27300.1 hypothetical protein J622_01522 [Acinetobacter sp. 1564232]DAL28601.1 MAG TPA_asm: hypothetical protein [Caudoviricetes sp.]